MNDGFPLLFCLKFNNCKRAWNLICVSNFKRFFCANTSPSRTNEFRTQLNYTICFIHSCLHANYITKTTWKYRYIPTPLCNTYSINTLIDIFVEYVQEKCGISGITKCLTRAPIHLSSSLSPSLIDRQVANKYISGNTIWINIIH